ncbi:MAG: hypothetical protein ACJA0G_001312 [Kangiellaceae bacterium]|jgi:hypothetical protein
MRQFKTKVKELRCLFNNLHCLYNILTFNRTVRQQLQNCSKAENGQNQH